MGKRGSQETGMLFDSGKPAMVPNGEGQKQKRGVDWGGGRLRAAYLQGCLGSTLSEIANCARRLAQGRIFRALHLSKVDFERGCNDGPRGATGDLQGC